MNDAFSEKDFNKLLSRSSFFLAMAKQFYITTAIAYPNGPPHMGHALEIIQADALARFYRLQGKDVFFQTGTDEHGTKNWQTAQEEGMDIKEFLDRNVGAFAELYKLLNVSYDNFVRTTDNIHYAGAQTLWKALAESGDIYKKTYEGLYCVGCESFKTEKELVNGKCPHHPTREIELVKEENYFFRLSKYKDELIEIIGKDEYKVVPTTRKNEILSFLKTAQDVSFSRPKTSLPWGIPVPGDEEHVMYVWCDALSNYITGIGYGTDELEFKKMWPADIHVVGKDILRFHAGVWPAMLLSADILLPRELFVHGFLQVSGQKMAKSTGVVVDPFEQVEEYGVDPFRFYILGAMSIDGDGDYTEEAVVERINNELVANLSNLCYRVLSFVNKNFDSEIKDIEDDEIIEEITKKFDSIKEEYEKRDFKMALGGIMEVSALGNKYFQHNEPWKVIKVDKEKAHRVLGTCVNIIKCLSILVEPVMPGFSVALQDQLNFNFKDLRWEDLNFKTRDHTIGKAKILVRKVEEVDREFPLNLKVAEIVAVADHPDADKLYVLQVNLGTERRQLVAGIKKEYSVEELVGKKIVVVTNLKKARLRGVESQGMLLAGDDGERIGLLTVKDAQPGDHVAIDGFKAKQGRIRYDEFCEVKMIVKGGKVYWKDLALKTDSEEVTVERVADGAKVC